MKRAVIVLAILAAPLYAQRYEDLMEKGAQADLRGKTVKAANRFEAAILAADTPEKRVDARFAYIAAVASGQQASELAPELAADVEQQYRSALAEAAGVQSFKAHHDFGIFLRARKRTAEAIEVFAAGENDFASVAAVTRARYLYNAAQALLEAERYEEALTATRRVLELDPSLGPTAGKAFSILAKLPPERAAADAVAVVEWLLDAEQLDLTRAALADALDPLHEAWHRQAAATSKLLAVFARWAVESDASSEDVVTNWMPRLERVAALAGDDEKQKVSELAALYADVEIPISFEADYEIRFRHWPTPEEQQTLSALAMLAGEEFLDKEAPARAVERFVVSWRLYPRNLDPLIYLVSIVTEWKEAPAGLLDELVAAVFEREGVRDADPDALLRFHLVLGSIFEEREQWGPREAVATAVYQYERALNAYVRVHKSDPTLNFPGVHARLATAYRQLDLAKEAWEQYVIAAEASLAEQDDVAARVMLEGARTCGYSPSDAEAVRLGKVDEALAAYEDAPASDATVEEEVRAHLWADPTVDAENLDVSVENGVVNLNVPAADRQAIEEATVAAQSIDGVKDVKVEVTAPPPPR